MEDPTAAAEFWREVLKAEPLSGEHWETSQYDSKDDSDSELAEDSPVKNVQDNLNLEMDCLSLRPIESDTLASSFLIPPLPKNEINQILDNQYWCQPEVKTWGGEEFDLLEPNTLTPSIAKHRLNTFLYASYETLNCRYTQEIDIIREVIFMLLGRETTIFDLQDPTFTQKAHSVSLRHVSQEALGSLFTYFGSGGRAIRDLKSFGTSICRGRPSLGQVSQAYASALLHLIGQFEKKLMNVEQSLYSAGESFNTVIKLKAHIDSDLRMFRYLSQFHTDLARDTIGPNRNSAAAVACGILNRLYQEALDKQVCNEEDVFKVFAFLFQRAFEPYARMINTWIFEGQLKDICSEFMIVENNRLIATSAFAWKAQFLLRDNSTDVAHQAPTIPDFLHDFGTKILFAGKGINLLQTMSLAEGRMSTLKAAIREHLVSLKLDSREKIWSLFPDSIFSHLAGEYRPDQTFHMPSALQHLFAPKSVKSNEKPSKQAPSPDETEEMFLWRPFRETLTDSLDKIITPQYVSVGKSVYNILCQNCGLSKHFEALRNLYLMQAGTVMHILCNSIFFKINKHQIWQDARTLNGLLIEANRAENTFDLDLISIQVAPLDHASGDHMEAFNAITLNYNVPWPLNNIITGSDLDHYKKISCLLIQVKRAKSLMEDPLYFKEKFINRTPDLLLFYSLRLKLIAFINGFYYYVMTMVLHGESGKFQHALERTFDIDQIIEMHSSFVKVIFDRCLLNPAVSASDTNSYCA
ncbi:hypothetical protein K493DRAFT_86732 [Basidiobolus meristosporus CBS 931.73]|uniref:Spindle pole body component n=1 Tax=Basidiobolus meristosporus CBS 931.73 TaxID=1314790 RepID=A0A1Y1XGA0_9FUNG|nr:hypothetical protein K493DRAFT_86732 [Basidiobolus meristosporus CBS 931.73]|eukprot:ORX84775.1 hypothetical protein K493DRAFT_86732 [Basidiobolus meristosporus CBS 931.73]